MVDLRGAIFGGESNVLDQMVVGFIEKQAGGEVYQKLAILALEPGRFDDTRDNDSGYKLPESRIQRLERRAEVHFCTTPLKTKRQQSFQCGRITADSVGEHTPSVSQRIPGYYDPVQQPFLSLSPLDL